MSAETPIIKVNVSREWKPEEKAAVSALIRAELSQSITEREKLRAVDKDLGQATRDQYGEVWGVPSLNIHISILIELLGILERTDTAHLEANRINFSKFVLPLQSE